jgi:hypothetical protein
MRDEQRRARPGERIGRRDHDGAGGIAALTDGATMAT